MSAENTIKKSGIGSSLLNRLKNGTTMMTGAHLGGGSAHVHGSGCGCSGPATDEDEDME